ncbi:MAG TPA: hypothetical protein PKA00_14510 [Saprospiraceae bacterium]|nr:hypothetical protein [Saprospiraceae bacterium]HMQ84122.1 hypothetical protein [Saprospiraceae bacterium]
MQFKIAAFRQLGYATMLGLVLLSALFYKERAVFVDVAFQTFLMINEGTVQVMVNRFGAALVQLLPLLAIKLEAPLALVSFCYSISFTLLYLLVYHLIVRYFKNDYLGWTLIFLYTLMIFDGFYWPPSELQQGLAVLLLFWAFLLRYPQLDRAWVWAIVVPAQIALAYYHPLVFIPFFFLWAFFALHFQQQLWHKRYWLLAVLMVLVLAFKSKFSPNWYDAAKYASFLENLESYFPNYLALPANVKFLENCGSVWYFFPLLLFVNTMVYLRRRAWLKTGLMWAACLGFLFLVHIGSPNASYRFYFEITYMPLMVFVGAPFMFDVAHKLLPEKQLIGLFAVAMLWRLAVIALNHQPFTARLHWLEANAKKGAAQENTNRLLWSYYDVPMDTLLMTWGIPYESLLLTAMAHPDSAKTIYVAPDFQRYEQELHTDTVFLSDFKAYPSNSLNSRYYRLPNAPYRKIERK